MTAYAAHQQEWVAAMRACKTRLAERLLSLPDAYLNGPAPEDGAPHILNVSFPGVRGEVLLHALEQREIYVSTGSACSAHKKGNNRVLAAAACAARGRRGRCACPLCPFNTLEEMDRAAEEIGPPGRVFAALPEKITREDAHGNGAAHPLCGDPSQGPQPPLL